MGLAKSPLGGYYAKRESDATPDSPIRGIRGSSTRGGVSRRCGDATRRGRTRYQRRARPRSPVRCAAGARSGVNAGTVNDICARRAGSKYRRAPDGCCGPVPRVWDSMGPGPCAGGGRSRSMRCATGCFVWPNSPPCGGGDDSGWPGGRVGDGSRESTPMGTMSSGITVLRHDGDPMRLKFGG